MTNKRIEAAAAIGRHFRQLDTQRLTLLRRARLTAIERFRDNHPLIGYGLRNETRNRVLERNYSAGLDIAEWSDQAQGIEPSEGY